MKILFLASNPQSTSRLNLGKEAREIKEGLKRSRLADKFEFVQRWAVRPQDLRRALLEENPDIVHFSGHGEGDTGLVLENEVGEAKPATGEALADLFSLFPSIKCVLLNACYAEIQAKSIVRHIDYVIGMRHTVLDDLAIFFATGFYDGLGYGRTIDDAFKFGRSAILFELSSTSDPNRKMIPVDFEKVESQATLSEHLKPILLKKTINVPQNITLTNNQPIHNKTITTNTNSIQEYQERIKEYLADRNLTPIAKFQLATFAKEQGISESEANNILEAELGKIEQAKKDYQTVLRQTIEQGYYPFNEQLEQQLKDLQTSLKLSDLEVEEISKAILEQAEIQIRTKTITFEVTTVDDRGIENSRIKKEADVFREDLGNGVTLEMVSISGGEFLMGTDDEEIARLCKKYNWEGYKRERPRHKANIPSLLMGRYPVTQAQWRVVAEMDKVLRDLESNPSHFKDDNLPVEQVSWDDAVEFCARLSNETDRDYRLPSEAEWEYACRAGTDTPFYFGATITTDLANYRGTDWEYKGKVYPGNFANEPKGKFRGKTTSIQSFPPNAFGLYDMHGNVWEWCADDWNENYNGVPQDGAAWLSCSGTKVIRGGSWSFYPGLCRCAYRNYTTRDNRDDNIGFRVVCVVPRTT
ncbi:SUMF1/EgtB/PvdO family nonheme iron enzyme [Pleurocapsa sp. PCC 7319]|uniref:SUMF1/EgtB/PvdO family nonheme iron enzyme n=1 Tax=Pleurocapsa sp. PCC 7319 TaxID=118161 RepID=UPI0003497232|nr:SUMF1/EgtB/PvdO family nonheme iron enzyme [Pleurocapsa sp. PCC 7319]